jgi:hypothetical protein
MKKMLIFSLAFMLLSAAFTQSLPPADPELTRMSVMRHHAAPSDIPTPMHNETFATPGTMKSPSYFGETEIIETVFDLQSNATIANRFIAWDDGSMAAVATYGVQNPANYAFPDRGTGYNYYTNYSWNPKPTQRIESERTGWPSIAKLGPNGEIIVSHVSGTATLKLLYRMQKGTGDWIEEDFPPAPAGASGLLWPRVITSGPDNMIVHVFVLSAPEENGGVIYEDQDGALLYYRSTDAGQTWDIQGIILEGLGADYYNGLRSDCYSLAVQDDMVVLLYGDAWKDMFLMKSLDNGDTWEKIMIWEHPYPFFDFNTTLMDDTLYAVDNSSNMSIDYNGMVHVVWGVGRVARLAAAPPDPGFYSYWPYTDGIGYWNENMGQIPEADNPHHTMMPEHLEQMDMLAGWTQDVNNSGFVFDFEGTAETPFAVYRSLGISTMPTIAIDFGLIYLIYSSVTETFVTTDGLYNYHHIWGRYSHDMGHTWSEFVDLVGENIFHLYDECIYPVLAQNFFEVGFQLIYNADNYPGIFAFADDHEPTTNRIIHLWDRLVGVDELPEKQTQLLDVSQNYPNPAYNITQIVVDLFYPSFIKMEVFNITGQKTEEMQSKNLQPGNHRFSLDVSGYTPGIYFYTVKAGDEQVTRRMVVR